MAIQSENIFFLNLLIFLISLTGIYYILTYLSCKSYTDKFTTDNTSENNITSENNTTVENNNLNSINTNKPQYNFNDRVIDDVSCNLSQNLPEDDNQLVNDFKNKYYSKYSHQIECGNRNQTKTTGCGKINYYGNNIMKKCNSENNEACLNEYEILNNNSDVMVNNFLAITNNNKKDCVQCNYSKLKFSKAEGVQSILDQLYGNDNVFKQKNENNVNNNNLNEHFELDNSNKLDNNNKLNNKLSPELEKQDNELAQVKKVRFSNCNKYANFSDYIEQNGVMETGVDRMAQIRTQESETCGLKSYGNSIANVYDKLVANPYMEHKKSNNVERIDGLIESVFKKSSGFADFEEIINNQ